MTAPSVALVDHGMGNLRSVAKALEAAGAGVRLVREPSELQAEGVCLPGQGIFGRCMQSLRATGFGDAISGWVAEGRPLLGICLGLQVLLDASEEPEDPTEPPSGLATKGLGLIPGDVVRMAAEEVNVPHIGWNVVEWRDRPPEYFYFDHSYVALPRDAEAVAATSEHGSTFTAAVRTGSILAVQFHPEKSGRSGISLLQEWVRQL